MNFDATITSICHWRLREYLFPWFGLGFCLKARLRLPHHLWQLSILYPGQVISFKLPIRSLWEVITYLVLFEAICGSVSHDISLFHVEIFVKRVDIEFLWELWPTVICEGHVRFGRGNVEGRVIHGRWETCFEVDWTDHTWLWLI